MLDNIWTRSIKSGIGRYILRMDDDSDNHSDGSEADEVAQVVNVLWRHQVLINAVFDYYATVGASDDITHVGPNGFSQFATDCQLVEKSIKYANASAFDQLFIGVDASSSPDKTDEKYNRKKALNRQEFVHCLVKIACMRYVMPGTILDYSAALDKVLDEVQSRLDSKVFSNPNSFRTTHCYQEETDDVLRKYEASLRLIFERACKIDGQKVDSGVASKMVSYAAWKEVTKLFKLVGVDPDVTERDATLAFTMSRMRVSNEDKDKSRIMLTHLSFEDVRLC